jgi:hypothetical protein
LAQTLQAGETIVVENVQDLNAPAGREELELLVGVPIGERGAIVAGWETEENLASFDLRLMEVLARYAEAVLGRIDREEALREERDLLDRLLATSPAAIVLLDEEGQFVYANEQAETVMGIGADEVTERAFNDPEWRITAPDGSPMPEDELPYARVISTGEVVRDIQHAIEWPDGSRRILSVSGAPLQDADGNIEGTLFHISDVTDRRRRENALREAKEEAEEARAEAEQASQLKSAMLANMSHEIRTPLTSIIGFAEAIGKDREAANRFAPLIEKSGKRLLETLDGVLNLSKLEAGQMELAAQPIDLTREARQTAEELRPKANDKQIDLQVQEEEPVRARADEGGVQIVARNLISNAIKYTKEGGAVQVRTYRENGAAVLEVEDTGIGMNPEMAEELFEPFRQESEGLRREFEGTGVGLAVTKEATEQMNGTIEVETEKGEGSRFTVRLPRAEDSNARRRGDGCLVENQSERGTEAPVD